MGQIADRVAEARRQLEANPGLADDTEFVQGLAELDALLTANPLQAFEPHVCRTCQTHEGVGCLEHKTPQLDWFHSRTRVIAAFAGNRFGKTTALVIRSLIECVDEECLPPHLRPFKRWNKQTAPRGTFGRIVNPSFGLLESVILDAFRQWAPKEQLVGESFDKAFKGPPHYKLSFKNGSFIQFLTHEQELSKFGGAARHFIGYDEPPPADIRQECRFRTIDYGGYEMFACTPLKVNVGWMRQDIFKKREHPDITVIRGSIHDNPTLDEGAKQAALGDTNDLWRAARESGDFVAMGGLVYTDFEQIIVPRPTGEFVRGLDPCVGIDPGIRNAAFVFGGFDKENTLHIFDELLLQDATVDDYAAGIRDRLKRWSIPETRVEFVIDPAARSRTQVNAEEVESALARLGIYCVHGQNALEAGCQQVRSRIQHRRLWCSEECVRTRNEADDYAMEDRDDGEFRPIKTATMHLLDSLRYMAMHRPFDAVSEAAAPSQNLGWVPGADRAPPASWLRREPQTPPMGSMS